MTDGRTQRKEFENALKINEEQRKKIVDRFCQADVVNMSLKQAFYKLLDEDEEYWCSLSSLYRIFKEAHMNKSRAPIREARRRYQPTSYAASAPNEVWTWDITYFRTSKYTGRFYYAYVIVDIYSRYIISAKVYDADNAQYAGEFLADAFAKENIRPNQLVVHSDNGASMKANSTLALLDKKGVTFSHSRPRVSNDNPYSESLFRTLKYSGEYRYPADGFQSLEQAQKWLDGFVHYYNVVHRHDGIRMVTPATRFRGMDKAILAKRKKTMQRARQQHPERWVQSKTLCCDFIPTVWLNPDNGKLEDATKLKTPPVKDNLTDGAVKSLFTGTSDSDRSYLSKENSISKQKKNSLPLCGAKKPRGETPRGVEGQSP